MGMEEVCSSSSSLSSFSSHRQVVAEEHRSSEEEAGVVCAGVVQAMWTFMVVVPLNDIRVDANLCDLQNIGLPEDSYLSSFSLSLALFSCPLLPHYFQGLYKVNCRIVEFLGEFPTEPVTSEAHPYPHRSLLVIRSAISELMGFLAELMRSAISELMRSLLVIRSVISELMGFLAELMGFLAELMRSTISELMRSAISELMGFLVELMGTADLLGCPRIISPLGSHRAQAEVKLNLFAESTCLARWFL
ncbi:hypothetical protein Taro_015028 [Colocasia esculenta]|uniref:Uncharacterized protein n=1 Tax=Colocasia esculenta TaxID=4460 RepID=A0A843UGG7_COLES|nr:hypothetical protein [Colocasia esculenta]